MCPRRIRSRRSLPLPHDGGHRQGCQGGTVGLAVLVRTRAAREKHADFASFCFLPSSIKGDQSGEELLDNYRYATDNGILKVMSKMGISTLQSYKGAQVSSSVPASRSFSSLIVCSPRRSLRLSVSTRRSLTSASEEPPRESKEQRSSFSRWTRSSSMSADTPRGTRFSLPECLNRENTTGEMEARPTSTIPPVSPVFRTPFGRRTKTLVSPPAVLLTPSF